MSLVKNYLVGFQANSGYYVLLKARQPGPMDPGSGITQASLIQGVALTAMAIC